MRLRIKIGLTLLLLTICLLGFSQNKTNDIALTLDICGNSGLYSINSEYEIGNFNNFKLNTRIGIGYFAKKNYEFFGIPIGLNLLTGLKSHHLELGLGASFIKGMENFPIYDLYYSVEKMTQSKCLYFVPSIGYRYDKLTKGLILKIYYSPLINVYNFNKNKYEFQKPDNLFVYFGISFGHRF